MIFNTALHIMQKGRIPQLDYTSEIVFFKRRGGKQKQIYFRPHYLSIINHIPNFLTGSNERSQVFLVYWNLAIFKLQRNHSSMTRAREELAWEEHTIFRQFWLQQHQIDQAKWLLMLYLRFSRYNLISKSNHILFVFTNKLSSFLLWRSS